MFLLIATCTPVLFAQERSEREIESMVAELMQLQRNSRPGLAATLTSVFKGQMDVDGDRQLSESERKAARALWVQMHHNHRFEMRRIQRVIDRRRDGVRDATGIFDQVADAQANLYRNRRIRPGANVDAQPSRRQTSGQIVAGITTGRGQPPTRRPTTETSSAASTQQGAAPAPMIPQLGPSPE